MSQVPGQRTTTQTSTVNGVTTTVTTIYTPGQPTKVITTTTKLRPVEKQPSGQEAPLPQPQMQPRPSSQQQQYQSEESSPKRKSGFFANLKKHVFHSDKPQAPTKVTKVTPAPQQPVQQPQPQPQQQQQQQQQQKPLGRPLSQLFQKKQQQQQQQQQPQKQQHQPVQQQPQQQQYTHQDDGPMERLAEKLKDATLHRPKTSEHHTTTVTHHHHHHGDLDPVTCLKKCAPVVTNTFNGQRLDPEAIDFSREDAHARACPKSETVSIERLSKYLTTPFAGDKVSQLRTIFTWIAENISYDVRGYLSGRWGDQSPEAVLKSRVGVCEGYANLYRALAKVAGLQVFRIAGRARGIGYRPGDNHLGGEHAWNATVIDGEYLLIDSTWGAGICNAATQTFEKKFRPFYFLLRPNRMIYSHYPEKTEDQFLDPPIDEDTFRRLPVLKPETWQLGIKIGSKGRGNVVHCKDDYGEVELRLKKRPSDGKTGKIVGQLQWDGHSQITHATVQWDHEDAKYVYMVVKFWCPAGGQGHLNIFGWPPGGDQTKPGPQVLSFMVKNEGSGKKAQPAMQTYVVKGFSFSVLEPLSAAVKKNVPTTIRVRCYDIERGTTPAVAIQGPAGGMPIRLTEVEPNLFAITKSLEPGQWKIVNMTSEYGFSFMAVFDAK
ncbi:hypothetical protein BGW41_005818 [Actinomortierella wolfii]|nr:hypothetical protein BGW41_005818 [Actinomortierella wolfii]